MSAFAKGPLIVLGAVISISFTSCVRTAEQYPYQFRPQPDITAYELALILATAQDRQRYALVAYERLPPELQRHFIRP
jgi:hypothetical protein